MAGERIVVGPIDISALRERETRRASHARASHEAEAYPIYRERIYPPPQPLAHRRCL